MFMTPRSFDRLPTVILTLGLAWSARLSLHGQDGVGSQVGWQTLFDGKTTAGWRSIGKPTFPSQGWTVEDGCLKHLKRGGGGDLITTANYSDFDLRWEWKLGPGANSGVKYMIIEKRGPIGHEYQMLDDASRPPNKNSTGSLYDLLAPQNPPLRPAGEFNVSRILVQGDHVEHWLNGARILQYQLGSDALKAAVAKSKFRNFEGFGSKVTGPILLQDHNGEVWFRNLRILNLSSREGPLPPPVELSQEEKAAGWQLLFDGQSTAQWHSLRKTSFPAKGWEIDGGCLHILPKGGGGDVICAKAYTNFEFSWEWRPSYDCNSGVKYLIREEHGSVGCEYQLLDDLHNIEGKVPKVATASVYDVLGATNLHLRPLGEFNRSQILVQGNHVEHWLNSSKVVDYELQSPDFKAAVAKSKFKNSSFYGVKVPGHILLQDHGHEIWFRNLKIRELP